ncbi:MAG: trypsin-like peptidase domain-containing protein [Bacteriovoracaceae bacterium]|nr:trypsin-like peptidase domain-containing protein [Bacteriovoracaceae bacterium]
MACSSCKITQFSKLMIFTIILSCGLILSAAAELLPFEQNNIKIFQENAASVVNVQNIKLGHTWWDYQPIEVPQGAGSGFVWDQDGHIVTNYHVVAEGNSFVVTFKGDSKSYKAKVVGVEPKKDIAVLVLTEKRTTPFNPIKIGSSKGLQVGQQAITIGSPFGLDHTMTSGIISAVDRSVLGIGGVSIRDVIQTDAAINPGNSGGPLLNSSGELIGMNTMIVSGSGSNAGVGFAVPVDAIKSVVPQLIEHGKVIRPGLGVAIVDEVYNERLGIKSGVIIARVEKNGPADKAGIKGVHQDALGNVVLGDIIVGIDEHKIATYDDLYNTLDKYKINDEISLKIIRQKQEQTVKVKLGAI